MATRKPTDTRNSPSVVVPHTPETKVRVTIEMGASLFDLLETQAIEKGELIESYIVDKLNRTREYTAMAPLYFNDVQRARLERILDHNITNVDVALNQIEGVVSLQVGDVGIQLTPKLQQRLASRVFRGETFEKVVTREVTRALEVFCGLA